MGYYAKDRSYVREDRDYYISNEDYQRDQNQKEIKKWQEEYDRKNKEAFAREEEYLRSLTPQERQEYYRKKKETAEREAYEAACRINREKRQKENERIDARLAEEQRRRSVLQKMEEDKYNQEKQAAAAAVAQKEAQSNSLGFSLRNPKTLSDRRARANYWAQSSLWRGVKDRITGKHKKFNKLWKDFSNTNDVEEQRIIVEQMEKLYPTTEKMLDKEEERLAKGKR